LVQLEGKLISLKNGFHDVKFESCERICSNKRMRHKDKKVLT